VIYCGDSTAVVEDFFYTGEEPPSGRIALISQYRWSNTKMKWVKRVVGYH
jgi:hypothetical protein